MSNIPSRFVLCESHQQDMLRHVLACLPEEGCGLVGGHFNPRGPSSLTILPVTNQLHSPVRFYMDPLEQLKALSWLDDNGLELVAIFHTHPVGPSDPSPTDLSEFAYPGVVYLILSPGSGEEWQIRAYWIEEDGLVLEIPLEYISEC